MPKLGKFAKLGVLIVQICQVRLVYVAKIAEMVDELGGQVVVIRAQIS